MNEFFEVREHEELPIISETLLFVIPWDSGWATHTRTRSDIFQMLDGTGAQPGVTLVVIRRDDRLLNAT